MRIRTAGATRSPVRASGAGRSPSPCPTGTLSRRRLLLGLGLASGALALAACGAEEEALEAEAPPPAAADGGPPPRPEPRATTPPPPPPTLPPVERTPQPATAPSPTGTAAIAPAGPVQLGPAEVRTLIPFETPNRPEQADILRELAQTFSSREPNVTIGYVRLVPTDRIREELAALFDPTKPPDVMLPMSTEGLHAFVHQGAWLEVMPLARRDGLDLNAFHPEAMAVARGASYWGPDSDRLHGLPIGLSSAAVAVRADLAASAGLDVETLSAGWTLDQLRTTADLGRRVVSGQVERWGIAGWETDDLIAAFGGREMDAPGARMTLTEDPYVAGVANWRDDIYERDLSPNPLERAAVGGVSGLWSSGSLALRTIRLEAASEAATQADFPWILAPPPRGPAGPASRLGVSLALVTARTTDPEAAWRWVRFLAGAGNVTIQLSRAFGSVSALSSERARYLNVLADELGQGQGTVALGPAVLPDDIRADVWTPRQAEIRGSVIRPALRRIEAGAEVRPELAAAEQTAQALVDEWLATGPRALSQRA